MPATQIAIYIATESKMIRGVLVPDSDEQLTLCRTPAGETMLIVPAFNGGLFDERGVPDPANYQYVIDQVVKATGVTPPDPRCAVVDQSGVVEAMICADPAIDSVTDRELIQAYHPEIAVGCLYDRQSREFTVPAKVIPASVDKQGKSVAEAVLPAKLLSRA